MDECLIAPELEPMLFCSGSPALVKTVPVKLIRAQNDDHAKHVDGMFCTATITHLEELSSMLGPKEVCFISQDDKCRVPISVTAANKQSPDC